MLLQKKSYKEKIKTIWAFFLIGGSYTSALFNNKIGLLSTRSTFLQSCMKYPDIARRAVEKHGFH